MHKVLTFINKYNDSNKGGEILALEAIGEIKKAEAKAEELVSEATAKAKEIIRNANLEADKQYNEILEKAKAKKMKLMQDAQTEGDKEAEPILTKGEKEVQDIRNVSGAKKDNAINLVVERIVRIHGNS